MYNYKIGYHTYEEGNEAVLCHKEKFTKEQLTKMIAEAIYESKKIIKSTSFQCYFEGGCSDNIVTVPDWLVENKGFLYLNYECSWCAFGWAYLFRDDLNGEHSWRAYRDEQDELDEIEKYVKEIENRSKEGE